MKSDLIIISLIILIFAAAMILGGIKKKNFYTQPLFSSNKTVYAEEIK